MSARLVSCIGSADIGHFEQAKSKYGPENVNRSYALFRRFGTR